MKLSCHLVRIFFTVSFDQWVQRHRKCVAIGGDYVEKVTGVLDFDVSVTPLTFKVTSACFKYDIN